jgi:glyceraldehyde-3-phosphate dehydrogenase/erythrose-4-phosphate dehydrogenase
MSTKVAINGFGRIGRAVARIIFQRAGDLELVARALRICSNMIR